MEISGGEVTWLECILNRNLLTKHLQKTDPEPPASSLLGQFVINADKWGNGNGVDGGPTESDMLKSSRSRKNRLLKLMAMQTAAFLSWDLDIFGKLPIGVQNSLMNHVLAVSMESETEKINPSKFLQSLFHRWVIRTSQINKSTRTNNRVQNPVLLQSDQFVATDSIIASLDVEKSLEYLKGLVIKAEPGTSSENDRIIIPTQETFSGSDPDWTISCEIEPSFFSSMIHLDLGIYLLYEGNTPDAVHHFTHGQKIPTENFPFFKITKSKLNGYLRALGLVSLFDQNIEDRKVILPVLDKAGTEEVTRILLDADFQKLTTLTKTLGGQSSKENHTSGFSGYCSRNDNSFYSRRPCSKQLNGDSHTKELRDEPMEIVQDNGIVFQDIEEAISEKDSIYTKYMREQLAKSDATTKAKYEFVVKSFDTWTKADPHHRENYDVMFHKLANSVESKIESVPPGIQVDKTDTVTLDFQKLLQEREEEEAQVLLANDEEIAALDPNLKIYSDNFRDGDDQLKLMDFEIKLFSATNLESIKDMVVHYNQLSQGKSIMSQNLTDWDLPVPIVQAEENIPPGIFRDSVHMMMVVGRQNFKTQNFEAARSAFQMAINELEECVRQGSSWGFAQYNVRKLSQMLEWEILLTDITEMHTHWTSGTNPTKYSRIVERSFACLRCLHQNSDVSPRTDIVDNILIALINLGEYQNVIRFEEQQKRWPFVEFLALLARGCQDLGDKKDISASYRDLWNTILPLCMHTNSGKRGHAGKGEGVFASRAGLMWLFDRACSHTLFTLIVSLLCKLHNNILDDVSLQIHTEYLHIWPNIIDDVTIEMKTRISGSSKFHVRQVRGFILHLLERAIMVGGELVWWRCLGDVQLASENPQGALKCYIEQLAVLTDFFEKHTSVHWQDNQLFRRMIKCCEQLQCFTQAVILCQFLTEVDYSVSFGMAQEKVTLDAQDSLYAFIWDLTILEFLVNLHTKRNEFGKRQIAVKMLGLLELNANNNEEIQREATNLRKSQFMRGLAKRYIVSG